MGLSETVKEKSRVLKPTDIGLFQNGKPLTTLDIVKLIGSGTPAVSCPEYLPHFFSLALPDSIRKETRFGGYSPRTGTLVVLSNKFRGIVREEGELIDQGKVSLTVVVPKIAVGKTGALLANLKSGNFKLNISEDGKNVLIELGENHFKFLQLNDFSILHSAILSTLGFGAYDLSSTCVGSKISFLSLSTDFHGDSGPYYTFYLPSIGQGGSLLVSKQGAHNKRTKD